MATGFGEALQAIAARVPELQSVMITATDGIPVDKLIVEQAPYLDSVSAEYTTLLRASVSAAADSGLGALQELSLATQGLTALLVAITPEYFLFATLLPGALVGKARFAMKIAALELRREFE